MPYTEVSQLPDWVRKYPPVIQRMYLKVFNSVYSKILKESGDVKQAESRAFASAASVIKRRMEKHGASRYSYSAMINCAIDKFLGNIKG